MHPSGAAAGVFVCGTHHHGLRRGVFHQGGAGDVAHFQRPLCDRPDLRAVRGYHHYYYEFHFCADPDRDSAQTVPVVPAAAIPRRRFVRRDDRRGGGGACAPSRRELPAAVAAVRRGHCPHRPGCQRGGHGQSGHYGRRGDRAGYLQGVSRQVRQHEDGL